MSNVPVVLLFGKKNLELKSQGPIPWYETDELDVRWYQSDKNLKEILVENKPDVIVTTGILDTYQNLQRTEYNIRKRWLHFDDDSDVQHIGNSIYNCYVHNITNPRSHQPLISIITPTYKTGWRISRPIQSLLSQTYTNWEWIIVDDSDDEDTYSMLETVADSDHRIHLYKSHKHSGKIGNVKRQGFLLATGDFLVELDHDDELTPDCLELIIKASQEYPDAGFFYSDCTELFEGGGCVNYGDYWAFGYGSYRKEFWRGQEVLVSNQHNINPKTIRHIVGVPNHVRCWKRKTYFDIGCHNQDLHVADDYEIIIRTFLNTQMVRIPKLLYVQYMNTSGNTQDIRRKEIQRLVKYISWYYDERIHNRFIELGIDDYVWDDDKKHAMFYEFSNIQNPEIEQHCSLIATI